MDTSVENRSDQIRSCEVTALNSSQVSSHRIGLDSFAFHSLPVATNRVDSDQIRSDQLVNSLNRASPPLSKLLCLLRSSAILDWDWGEGLG